MIVLGHILLRIVFPIQMYFGRLIMIRLMKVRFFLICVVASALAACRGATKPDLSLFLKDNKAAVFVFLAPDCPLSQNYTLTLNRLHSEFERKRIGFFGIVAGDGFQKNDIEAFVKQYNVRFPVLPDRNFDLADSFGATKTPEAFVVAPDGKTLYKGAIDNWAVESGQHRSVITDHYLRDVLDNFLKGHRIPYPETTVIGCFIERKGRLPG